MKIRLKQTPAEWTVTLKVIDRKARKNGRKYLIYDYQAELATDGIGGEISRALSQAEAQSDRWNFAPKTKSKRR